MANVLKADCGGADAYLTKDLTLPGGGWYAEYEIAIPSSTLSAIIAAEPTGSVATADFFEFDNYNGTSWSSIIYNALGDPPTLDAAGLTSPATFWAQASTTHTEAFFTPDVWHHVQIHFDGTTVHYTVDGTAHATLDGSATYTGTTQRLLAGGAFAYADATGEVYYLQAIKVGTTLAGTDIFSEDFSGGTFAAWDNTTGGVSIVADPGFPSAGTGATAGLVSIAFSSTTLTSSPAWQTVDAQVVSWNTDRGRQSELEQVEAGTATVVLRDATGLLDVLNALGSYAGQIEPLKQIRIQEIDPRDGVTVATQFTGYIEDWDYVEDVAEQQLEITLTCVDGFDLLANSEVVPGPDGHAAYSRQQVDDAQRARLADAGWNLSKTQIATGNVYVKPVIYQAGTDILTTLHDCVDAEFKGVAISFISKSGDYVFHGRKIRFDPSSYPTFVHVYTAADSPRQAGNNSWGRISDVQWLTAKDKVINACLVTPEGIADVDVPGQLVVDATTSSRGIRQQSFTGILCDGNVNSGTTDLQECLLVAHYYVDNFKTPLPQISQVVFTGRDPADPAESGTWNILLNVELGDLINIVTVDPGGGGFNAGFYVERIQQQAEAGGPAEHPKRTLTLAVSPQALYDTNPFAGTDT